MECVSLLSVQVKKWTRRRMAAATLGLISALVGGTSSAQYRYYCPEPCPPPTVTPQAPVAPAAPAAPNQQPDNMAPMQQAQIPEVDPNAAVDTTSDSAVASAADAAGVGMIGDSPSGFGRIYRTTGFGLLSFSQISTSSGDRLFKIAENTNPNPANRAFVMYNHFENTATAIPQVGAAEQLSVDRITVGIERAFCLLGSPTSIEVRVPVIVSGLNNEQGVNRELFGGSIGNVGVAVKRLLYDNGCATISGGLALMLPTGEDGQLFGAGPAPVLTLENEAVHLAPFLIGQRRVSDRLFVTGIAQLDFDLNGNELVAGAERQNLQDPDLLLLSGQLGYWLYDSCDPCALISRVAGIAELHYTNALDQTPVANFVGPPAGTVGAARDIELLNVTAGLHFQIGSQSTLRVAAVMPLDEEADRFFDSEFLVQFNRFF